MVAIATSVNKRQFVSVLILNYRHPVAAPMNYSLNYIKLQLLNPDFEIISKHYYYMFILPEIIHDN